MSTNTIMSKFSDQFKEIEKLTNSSSFTLNNARQKSTHISYSTTYFRKGVKSDHIRIFKMNDNKTSFGFAFYYEGVEKPYMDVTMKINDDIVSTSYSVLTTKEKIKEWSKILRVSSELRLNSNEFIEKSFKQIFLKKITSSKMTNAVTVSSKIEKELSNLFEDNKSQIEKYTETKEVVNNITIKIQKFMSKAEEKAEKDIKELNETIASSHAKIRKIKENISKKKADLEFENLLTQHKTTLKACQSNLKSTKNKALHILENNTAGLPREKRTKLVEKFTPIIDEKLD